jgi:hypothetical protein
MRMMSRNATAHAATSKHSKKRDSVLIVAPSSKSRRNAAAVVGTDVSAAWLAVIVSEPRPSRPPGSSRRPG